MQSPDHQIIKSLNDGQCGCDVVPLRALGGIAAVRPRFFLQLKQASGAERRRYLQRAKPANL